MGQNLQSLYGPVNRWSIGELIFARHPKQLHGIRRADIFSPSYGSATKLQCPIIPMCSTLSNSTAFIWMLYQVASAISSLPVYWTSTDTKCHKLRGQDSSFHHPPFCVKILSIYWYGSSSASNGSCEYTKSHCVFALPYSESILDFPWPGVVTIW